MAAVTLVLRPEGKGRFAAYLDGALICTSKQPLLDGARELLRRGYDPATLLTSRHEGKAYDSFVPAPIGDLAKLTVRDDKFEKYVAPTAAGGSPMRESPAPAPQPKAAA